MPPAGGVILWVVSTRPDDPLLSQVLTPEQLDGLAEDWQAFVSRTGSADRDLFVQYLHQQGLISHDQLVAALRLRGRPELTDIRTLDLRIQGRGSSERTYATMSPAGQYALLGRIGFGAMGEVLVGKDHDLKRKVAYKRLTEKYRREDAVRQRFLAEAQFTAQLDHPSIPPVYSLELGSGGHMGYAMKLIEGQTLRELLDVERVRRGEGRPPRVGLADRLELFLRVCDAVAYAHSRGVLHRDLKPDNVMVGRFGATYLMDWGLARLIGEEEEVRELPSRSPHPLRTRVGAAVGTPAYMSPEQARGNNTTLDGRSDQYALGLILQELVTLEPAVASSSAAAALEEAALARRGAMEGGPVTLRRIVDRACARRPEARFPDVASLAVEVRRFQRGELSEGRAWLQGSVGLLILVGALVAITLSSGLLGSGIAIFVGTYAQDQREARMGQILVRLGEQALRIERELQQHEQTLEVLASGAGALLLAGTPDLQARLLEPADFAPGGLQPIDLALDPRLDRPVSRSEPVFALAPGAPRARLLAAAHRLVRLRSELQRVVTGVPGQGPRVDAVHIGTADGLYMALPGHGALDEGYDPRREAWYRRAMHRSGPVWGDLRSAPGQGLLISCSRALHSPGGSLLGVVGVEIALNHLAEALLAPPGLPIEEAWLLDKDGRILLVASSPTTPPAPAPHPDPAVMEAAIAGRSAGLPLPGGRWRLVYPLGALGWSYVAEIQGPVLIGG
ncbi:MAG TPA: hypothetical protein ENK18_00530 [Deltaproteobacteria bacterium]|nr:hypothetical protein [Deltaproteobacteria bacterium]